MRLAALSKIILTAFCTLSLMIPVVALAQDTDDSDRTDRTDRTEVKPPSDLPPAQSDTDPRPAVPGPTIREAAVVKQAGIGGPTGYARGGVLELGGGIAFNRAGDDTVLTLSPTLGWFFMDNVELSAILNFNYARVNSADITYFTGLVEPSVHFPFSSAAFGFLGLGLGVSYAEATGAGFAMAPRVGVNVLVGRSGVLTPAFTLAYATNEAIPTPSGTVATVNVSYGLNVGYTVMW